LILLKAFTNECHNALLRTEDNIRKEILVMTSLLKRKRWVALLLAVFLAIPLGSGVALAYDILGSTYIGTGSGSTWWGSGFTETSPPTTHPWLAVDNKGQEYCTANPGLVQKWYVYNIVYNDWIVDILGDSQYSSGPCECYARLYTSSTHLADGYSSCNTYNNMAHPNASC
jgi:hypothetical protein